MEQIPDFAPTPVGSKDAAAIPLINVTARTADQGDGDEGEDTDEDNDEDQVDSTKDVVQASSATPTNAAQASSAGATTAAQAPSSSTKPMLSELGMRRWYRLVLFPGRDLYSPMTYAGMMPLVNVAACLHA